MISITELSVLYASWRFFPIHFDDTSPPSFSVSEVLQKVTIYLSFNFFLGYSFTSGCFKEAVRITFQEEIRVFLRHNKQDCWLCSLYASPSSRFPWPQFSSGDIWTSSTRAKSKNRLFWKLRQANVAWVFVSVWILLKYFLLTDFLHVFSC